MNDKMTPETEKEWALEIGARVALERTNRALTQADLAYNSRLSIKTISNVERGAQLPHLYTLIQLARTLGVSLDQLSIGAESPNPNSFDIGVEVKR